MAHKVSRELSRFKTAYLQSHFGPAEGSDVALLCPLTTRAKYEHIDSLLEVRRLRAFVDAVEHLSPKRDWNKLK